MTRNTMMVVHANIALRCNAFNFPFTPLCIVQRDTPCPTAVVNPLAPHIRHAARKFKVVSTI